MALTTKRPAPDPSSGGIYLYLEPLPQDADRLSFSLAGISAVKADGQEIPLTLRMTDLKGAQEQRQRFLAEGSLPEGEYTGLVFTLSRARIRNEDGEAALLLPEKPARQEFRFQIHKRQGTVLSVAFKSRESLAGGIKFDPVFSLSIPDNPLPTLTGYVSNEGSDSVTVFDKRAGRVARVIQTGRAPAGIALDQIRRKAYVAASGDDAVEIIDINQNEIYSRIRLHPGDEPRDIALASDGRTLLTVNTGSNTVSFIDTSSEGELSRVSVGNRPTHLVMERSGLRAYVFNNLSNTISVIDVASRSLAGTIPTDSGPVEAQFNRKGDRFLVIHNMSPYMLAVDARSSSTVKRVYVGMGASAVKVNPTTDYVYVGYRLGGKIDIFDPYSYLPADFVPSSEGISSMTIDGDENNLVIVHPRTGRVRLVNLVSKKDVAVIEVGEEPYWVALFGER